MAGKIFSKKTLIYFLAAGSLIWVGALVPQYPEEDEGLRSEEDIRQEEVLSEAKYALDYELRGDLREKLDEAISVYPQEGWAETKLLLEHINRTCRQSECDSRLFFNNYIDKLAEVLKEQEFIESTHLLGIASTNTLKQSDLNNDGHNEVIVLQQDSIQPRFMFLKVFDFSKQESQLVDYIIDEGYFDSPDSKITNPRPLKLLDLTGDRLPEILVFATSGRGGAHLHIFEYKNRKLIRMYKKHNIFYPTYTFLDVDSDGILEIIVEGHSSGPMPAFFKCPPCKEKKVKQVIKFIKDEENFRVIQEEKLPIH